MGEFLPAMWYFEPCTMKPLFKCEGCFISLILTWFQSHCLLFNAIKTFKFTIFIYKRGKEATSCIRKLWIERRVGVSNVVGYTVNADFDLPRPRFIQVMQSKFHEIFSSLVVWSTILLKIPKFGQSRPYSPLFSKNSREMFLMDPVWTWYYT